MMIVNRCDVFLSQLCSFISMMKCYICDENLSLWWKIIITVIMNITMIKMHKEDKKSSPKLNFITLVEIYHYLWQFITLKNLITYHSGKNALFQYSDGKSLCRIRLNQKFIAVIRYCHSDEKLSIWWKFIT